MSMIQVGIFASLSAIIHFALLRTLSQRMPVPASVLLGAVLSVVVYQLWVYIDLGFIEPFFQVAALVQLGLALLVGVIVALAFRRREKQLP